MRVKERLPENDVRVFIFSSHATGIEGDGKSISPSITDPKETHEHRLRGILHDDRGRGSWNAKACLNF